MGVGVDERNNEASPSNADTQQSDYNQPSHAMEAEHRGTKKHVGPVLVVAR